MFSQPRNSAKWSAPLAQLPPTILSKSTSVCTHTTSDSHSVPLWVGLWPPIKPRGSPGLPPCFEVQAHRNSLDPQAPLAPCSAQALAYSVPTPWYTLPWPPSLPTPLGLSGRAQVPRKPSLTLIQLAAVFLQGSSLAPYLSLSPSLSVFTVIAHFIAWHPHPNVRAKRTENGCLFFFIASPRPTPRHQGGLTITADGINELLLKCIALWTAEQCSLQEKVQTQTEVLFGWMLLN